MRPRPPYFMTTTERAASDVKAMLISIEENSDGEFKYKRLTQIQRLIRQEQLASLELKDDTDFLRNRRETDMASLARATRAHFDPTSLIDHTSSPFDYRSVDNYWEMSIRIARHPGINMLSLEELFRFAARIQRGKIPLAIRRVFLFDQHHQSQFHK